MNICLNIHENDILPDLKEVIAYISEARAVGLSQDEIISELIKVGWPNGAIRSAFAQLLKVPYPHTHNQIELGPNQPIIEVKNLTKKYGNFTAVDNISFSVQPGETFGILGPNDADKTTTMEMIEKLKIISGGTILVDNKNVAHQSHDVKSVIGVQLQASSFFDGLNLKELITTFASMYNRTVDPMELLEEVQLSDKADSQVKELSGGQKQRLSIAVGLVNDPKILFLDEPTTALVPQARHNLWDLVTSIKNRGKTIVITTHYMDEAEVLCDRIAIMDHARIVALDTTHNLLHSIGIDTSIEFKSGMIIQPEILRVISGVETFSSEDGTYTITTKQPKETLDGLFTASRQYKFDIDQLTMKRATLEDVFLKLTGHQLRD